jgi:hypothetical protein
MVSPYNITLCFFSFLIWQIAFTYFLIECRNTILFSTSNFIEKIINKFDNIIIIVEFYCALGGSVDDCRGKFLSTKQLIILA